MSKVQNELKKLTMKPQAPKGNGNSSNPQWRGPVSRVSDLAGERHQPLNPPTYSQWQGPVLGVADSPGGKTPATGSTSDGSPIIDTDSSHKLLPVAEWFRW